MERKVIGIDFGSSQSSIAVMEIGSVGKPELLNVGGGRGGVTIPTVLALDPADDTVIAYGNDVRKIGEADGENIKFVDNFKQKLGTDENANKYCKIFLGKLAEFVKERYNIKELDSCDYVTCIAHPATWSEEQIRLLKEYAEGAGFPADPDMGIYSVEEPVAAMHSLRTDPSMKFRFGNRPEYYMVIDFGGGTLDICIIKTDILGRTPKIVSTSGDPQLGGSDFDEIIHTEFFRNNDTLSPDMFSMREQADLKNKLKEAKEAFSENFIRNNVHSQPIHTPKGDYTVTMTKQDFRNICNDRQIFEKIRESIHEALEQAKIDICKIKKVILTGGSSKWFFLREIVAKEFNLGGESIFLTESPFTDVANGCAIKIGRPDAPPDKKGIWVRYKINDEENWSKPKCILKPGRSVSFEEERLFIATLEGSHLFAPYRITFSWWTGFEEHLLEQAEEEAVLELYARSNSPMFTQMKRAWQGLTTTVDVKSLKDNYELYLLYKEDQSGKVTYRFEFMDARSAYKETTRLTQGESAVQDIPDGVCEKGQIIPGMISKKGFWGMGSRMQQEIKNERE